MSSDLQVKIDVPLDQVNQHLLLEDSERIFKELLNVDFITRFCFIDSAAVGLTEFGYGVSLGDLEIEPHPPWVTAEAGIYAFASTGGIHSLPFVVAASVMLALAYRYQANIIDAGSRWVSFPNPRENGCGCSAATFQQAVANRRQFYELESAATEFHKRLPVPIQDADLLK